MSGVMKLTEADATQKQKLLFSIIITATYYIKAYCQAGITLVLMTGKLGFSVFFQHPKKPSHLKVHYVTFNYLVISDMRVLL